MAWPSEAIKRYEWENHDQANRERGEAHATRKTKIRVTAAAGKPNVPPTRVVIINDTSTLRGGAAEVAISEAYAFCARGVAVTLVLGDDAKGISPCPVGMEIVALSERPIVEIARFAGGIRGLFNWRSAKALSAWIEKNDTPTTVYHLHNWSHILSPSIFVALSAVKERLVMTIHDYFLACPNGGYLNYQSDSNCPLTPLSKQCLATNCDRRNYSHKLWRVARHCFRRLLFDVRKTDPILLTLHEGMEPYLTRGDLPERNMRVLRNPIIPFTSTRIAAEANREFLFIGRLEREKGPDLAARAARKAGVTLHLIGDGPMRSELEQTYPEFIFSGWRQSAEIGALLSNARALVMPSRVAEPFGMVAVQALWSGLPVIVASTALLAPEIVSHEVGLSCDVHDEAEFAAKMAQLRDSDVLTGAMSRRAFSQTGDFGNTPEQWIDKLTAVLGERIQTAARAVQS
jgi:glycosyltransferase involved in cell wall biosynthesis